MVTVTKTTVVVFWVLVAFSSLEGAVQASDPELITDFEVPPGVDISSLDGNYFTYTGFRGGVSVERGQVNNKEATVNEFPALYGLGISFFLTYFKPGGVLVPRFHPRASKLIYVIKGTLTIGFIDTTYRNYNQTLFEGDVFVVPLAMVHYMANLDSNVEAKTLFAFSSSNPGIVKLPTAIFGSCPLIPDAVLENSFEVPDGIVEMLEAPYAP